MDELKENVALICNWFRYDKKFYVGCELVSLKAHLTLSFLKVHLSLGRVGYGIKTNDIIWIGLNACMSTVMYIKSLGSLNKMFQYLDF